MSDAHAESPGARLPGVALGRARERGNNKGQSRCGSCSGAAASDNVIAVALHPGQFKEGALSSATSSGRAVCSTGALDTLSMHCARRHIGFGPSKYKNDLKYHRKENLLGTRHHNPRKAGVPHATFFASSPSLSRSFSSAWWKSLLSLREPPDGTSPPWVRIPGRLLEKDTM